MTKIYEALVHASEQRKESVECRMPLSHPQSLLESPDKLNMEREMLELYQAVESLLLNKPKRIIQFIGSQLGEGTSTISREFARVSATRVGKSVLLIDADLSSERKNRFSSSTDTNCSCLEAMKSGRYMDEALTHMGTSNFFTTFLSNNGRLNAEIFDSELIDVFWDRIRERFDLTIIDSPPLTATPDGLAIAPKADGIVLVVQAEKTRWTITENVKERITKAGGNILGIVFNKRRFYIPQFIYNRLR